MLLVRSGQWNSTSQRGMGEHLQCVWGVGVPALVRTTYSPYLEKPHSLRFGGQVTTAQVEETTL